MAGFEDTLARMKGLYTYGKNLNERTKMNSYSLEHSAVAADGKTYGIIRECNKYYIKTAQAGKETIAEAYNYLGGYCNKGNHEYDSYNKALKNFELKLASINEACEGNVNISTLDPFKKGDFIVEGTDKMKNEIARQRQIMHNVSMLMNESSEIGASRKDDVVKFDGKNPEAETGKQGDEGYTEVKANPEFAGTKKGFDPKATPFENKPVEGEDQLKESCDANGCDWASEGLPVTPGVGEADTDHNNDPFTEEPKKELNENDFFHNDDVDDDAQLSDTPDEVVLGEDDLEVSDYDFDEEESELDGEEPEFGEEEPEFDGEMDFESDMEESDDDILSRIEQLEAELEALKAQVSSDAYEMDSDVDELEADAEDMEANAEDMEADAEDMEADVENMEADAEEGDFESDFDDVEDDEFEDDMNECGDALMEAKRSYMNHIVECVVKNILNEDELHDWGKHPGYRKKPMNLPATGEDKNQWGEDWNDKSVSSEEPFGSKIGDGSPFNILADMITKDVMSQLAGDAFKKKE